MRDNRQRRVRTGLALAGLLALASLLAGCGVVNNILGRSGSQASGTTGGFGGAGGGFGGQTAALPVVTADVVRETVSSFLVATTTLTAERSIDVVARAGGAVIEVLVQEGDAVRAGQLLAQLDQDDARLALAEAQAHYDNIQREYERTAELAKHGGVTQRELENQRYQIELRTIALERSRQQLGDTEIRSPLTGIVGERSVEPGATISANTRLFHVLDPDPLLAVIHVPDAGRQSLSVGQEVQIQAAGDIRAAGTIIRVSPVVDAESGTVKVTVELNAMAAAGALVPGTFVTVQVPTETRPDALVVPKRAILLERDQSIVYRVQEGVAVRTVVALGLSARELVEVTSGLSAGDVVVTVGHESLGDGSAVRAAGEPLPETAVAGASAGGPGGAGGGFSLAQLPAERRQALVQRLLENPQVKQAYEAKLQEDPSLERGRGEAVGIPGGAAPRRSAARRHCSAAARPPVKVARGRGPEAAARLVLAKPMPGGRTRPMQAVNGQSPPAAARAGAATGAAAGGGPGGGGFSLAQMPAERRQVLVERLLQHPDVKQAYEAKLQEDPSLENGRGAAAAIPAGAASGNRRPEGAVWRLTPPSPKMAAEHADSAHASAWDRHQFLLHVEAEVGGDCQVGVSDCEPGRGSERGLRWSRLTASSGSTPRCGQELAVRPQPDSELRSCPLQLRDHPIEACIRGRRGAVDQFWVCR